MVQCGDSPYLAKVLLPSTNATRSLDIVIYSRVVAKSNSFFFNMTLSWAGITASKSPSEFAFDGFTMTPSLCFIPWKVSTANSYINSVFGCVFWSRSNAVYISVMVVQGQKENTYKKRWFPFQVREKVNSWIGANWTVLVYHNKANQVQISRLGRMQRFCPNFSVLH